MINMSYSEVPVVVCETGHVPDSSLLAYEGLLWPYLVVVQIVYFNVLYQCSKDQSKHSKLGRTGDSRSSVWTTSQQVK